jgi:NADH-quinone oxidoreductase subunit M
VNGRELATALPFVVMVLVMGVLPGFFLDRLQTSTQKYVARAQVGLDVQQRDEDTRVTVLELPSSAPRAAMPPGASARR